MEGELAQYDVISRRGLTQHGCRVLRATPSGFSLYVVSYAVFLQGVDSRCGEVKGDPISIIVIVPGGLQVASWV